jgi:hypothetical protein
MRSPDTNRYQPNVLYLLGHFHLWLLVGLVKSGLGWHILSAFASSTIVRNDIFWVLELDSLALMVLTLNASPLAFDIRAIQFVFLASGACLPI